MGTKNTPTNAMLSAPEEALFRMIDEHSGKVSENILALRKCLKELEQIDTSNESVKPNLDLAKMGLKMNLLSETQKCSIPEIRNMAEFVQFIGRPEVRKALKNVQPKSKTTATEKPAKKARKVVKKKVVARTPIQETEKPGKAAKESKNALEEKRNINRRKKITVLFDKIDKVNSRIVNTLSENEIKTLGALTKKTEDELLELEGFGPGHLKRVKDALHPRGLTLQKEG